MSERKEQKPAWYKGAVKALKRFLVVFFVCFVWVLLGRFGIIPIHIFENLSLVVIVVVYVLALPLSAFLRIDELFDRYQVSGNTGLGIALLVMLVNFLLIGALMGAWRSRRAKRASESKT